MAAEAVLSIDVARRLMIVLLNTLAALLRGCWNLSFASHFRLFGSLLVRFLHFLSKVNTFREHCFTLPFFVML